MSLREEVLADAEWQWTYQRVIDALGDEAAEFEELLADPSVPVGSIVNVLQARGIKVSVGSPYRWAKERRP